MPDTTQENGTDRAGRRDQLVLTPEMSVPAIPRDTASAPSGGGAPVDEATLRTLVAEMVREELRGAIGTEATANIRKLVRREIRQALALHEID